MRREYWKKGDDGMEADRGDEDGTTVGVSTAVGEGRLWKNRSWGSGGPEEQALGATCLSPLSRPQRGARCPRACAGPGVGALKAQAAGTPHWLDAVRPGGDGWPGFCPAHLRRGPARAALLLQKSPDPRDASL